MRALLIFLLMCCGNAVAAVVQYDFSVDLNSGEQIHGSLLGELQGDGDTIDIVDLLSIEYTGGNLDFGGLDPWEQLDNVASLSGNNIEFRTDVPYLASPNGLIWFSGGGVSVWEFWEDPISPDGQTAFQIDGGPVNGSTWTITAVPVPAAVWLFASAVAGLSFLRRPG